MMQCLFYKTLDDIKVRCQLCPHNCTIPNEELGTCGVRYNDSGKLVCHTSVSGLHTDPIEKKPLYHFYPGKQILSVGTYGCNLQCSFCQNHSISQYCAPKNKKPHLYNPVDIINRAINQNNCIGIAFTYNEPTVWVEYMLEIAKLAKQNSLANAMVTNGYINPKPLDMILEFIDAFNIDLKGFSDKFYKKFTGGKLSPVLNTLKTIAKSGKHIEITYLVIPGLNDDETDFKKMAEWIASELGPSIPLHINRYYPAYKMTKESTPIETLLELREIASQHLHHIFIGNVILGKGESNTRCENCGNEIVLRTQYSVKVVGVNNEGLCKNCGKAIPWKH